MATHTPDPLLAQLWAAVLQYGSAIHRRSCGGPLPDGRAAWQPVKAACVGAVGRGVWGVVLTPRLDAALTELEALERGDDAQMAEAAHYFAQLLRLPRAQPCTLRRVLQVAYNLGQAAGTGAGARLDAARPALFAILAEEGYGELSGHCALGGAGIAIPASVARSVLEACQ